MTYLLGVGGIVLGLALLLFLGGLTSALVEAQRERRLGLPVSRPARDARRGRRASGGYLATLRGIWIGLRS